MSKRSRPYLGHCESFSCFQLCPFVPMLFFAPDFHLTLRTVAMPLGLVSLMVPICSAHSAPQFNPCAGPAVSQARASNLKMQGFLDKQSSQIILKFGMYHALSGLFSFVNIGFQMDETGAFLDNTVVDIQSVRLEPVSLPRAYLCCCYVSCCGLMRFASTCCAAAISIASCWPWRSFSCFGWEATCVITCFFRDIKSKSSVFELCWDFGPLSTPRFSSSCSFS
jgi:hypothetical protein